MQQVYTRPVIVTLLLFFCSTLCGEGFQKGTLVATPTGLCPIEKLLPGHRVISRTPTGHEAESIITTISQKLTLETYKVIAAQESMLTDKEQQFYVANKHAWCTVKSLSTDDMLISSDNQTAHIEDIQKDDNTLVTLYRLSVAPYHNFCVGNAQLVAHNVGAEFAAAKVATDAAIAIGSGSGIVISLPAACVTAGVGVVCYGFYSLIEHLRAKNKPQAPPIDPNKNSKKNDLDSQQHVRGFGTFTDEELKDSYRQFCIEQKEKEALRIAPCLPEIIPAIIPAGTRTIQHNQSEKEIVHAAPVATPASLEPDNIPRCGLQGQTLPSFDAPGETQGSVDSSSVGEQAVAPNASNESSPTLIEESKQGVSEIDTTAASPESASKDLSHTTESAATKTSNQGYQTDSYTVAQLDEIDAIDNTATKPVNELADLSDVLAKEEGRGNSKGRIEPTKHLEKLSMNEVMSNPKGRLLKDVIMTDPRWPSEEGWQKYAQSVDDKNGNLIEIHYVYSKKLNLYDDFKFKDKDKKK